MPDRQTYTYKTIDGCGVRADVYRAGSPGPAILWVHGGALIGGDRLGIPGDQLRAYLDAGFTVVSMDYRLAPETKLPGILDDLRDCWSWLRRVGPQELGIDPDQVAVAGHSAGGYLTLMAGFCLSPRPKALVAYYGYGDIAGAWYSRPDPFYCGEPAVPKEEAYRVVGGPPLSEGGYGDRFRFYLYCRQHGLWPAEVAGYDPDREPRAFGPLCPVRNVTPDYPPTMLLHGDRDTDVPYEQSVLMADALRREGVEHELITVPGGGHGFDAANGGLADASNAARFRRVLAFLHRHTR